MFKKESYSFFYQYLPFVVFGVGMLLLHFAVPIPIGDDIIFRSVPSGIFDSSFISERYFGWTSRIFIEIVLVALLHLPLGIWRFMNSGIMVFLAISISHLFEDKKDQINNWFLVFLLLIYPLEQISDAGWVTTTVNYLWPVAFGLYTMVVIRKILLSRVVKPYEFVFSAIALFFAVNNEVVCLAMLITIFVIAIYQMQKKSVHWFVPICLFICFASMIFILTTPGNALRRVAEMRWFYDFDDLSLINKVEIGLSSTLSHYFFYYNLVFWGFCLLLFLSVNHKYKHPFFKLFSAVPLIIVSLFGIVPNFFHSFPTFQSQLTKYGYITSNNFTNITSYIPIFILYITFILTLIAMYLVFGKSLKSFQLIGIFCIGLLTRLTLISSPTIWASGLRTHFFMYVSIIICSYIFFLDLKKSISKELKISLLTLFGFLGINTYIQLFIRLETLVHIRNVINIYIINHINNIFIQN